MPHSDLFSKDFLFEAAYIYLNLQREKRQGICPASFITIASLLFNVYRTYT